MAKSLTLIVNKLNRLLRFGIFSCVLFGLIFYIDTNGFYFLQLAMGFFFGIAFGTIEEITNHRKITSLSLPSQYLLKFAGFLLILFIITFWTIYMRYSLTAIDGELLKAVFNERRLTSLFISAFVVGSTVSVYFQIEKLVGKNMLTNYLKGKYRRPKKEIRVFLFMDLKSSTSILEKLGNDMYYSFLNDAITDMSTAIIETKAEIYQYVGDEIVFSWPLEKGITNNRCLLLFEKITETLERRRSYYLKHYGFVPEFKGALHAGVVLAAIIGHIKKNIVYSGDVLIATALMESLCRRYEAKLLISKSLFNLLDKRYVILYDELGAVELKGKDETIELLKIHLTDKQFDAERKDLEKVLQQK